MDAGGLMSLMQSSSSGAMSRRVAADIPAGTPAEWVRRKRVDLVFSDLVVLQTLRRSRPPRFRILEGGRCLQASQVEIPRANARGHPASPTFRLSLGARSRPRPQCPGVARPASLPSHRTAGGGSRRTL